MHSEPITPAEISRHVSPYSATECRGGRVVYVCWGCGRETTSRLVLQDDHEVHICTPPCAGTLCYTEDE